MARGLQRQLVSVAVAQPRNPLHGVTLEAMVTALAADAGWAKLAESIPVRCFTHDPSVSSSLKLLRKTDWARARTEALYFALLRRRAGSGTGYRVRRRNSAGPGRPGLNWFTGRADA